MIEAEFYYIMTIILTILNIILVALNTYWAYKRTCYNRDVYHGSKQYWDSWKIRQADVARKVIEGMSDEEIIALMKKLEGMQNAKKRKKSKNIQGTERGTEQTPQ